MGTPKVFDGRVPDEKLLNAILTYLDGITPKCHVEDHGIGSYEFWGTPGVDSCPVLVPDKSDISFLILTPPISLTEIPTWISVINELVRETGNREVCASQDSKELCATFNLIHVDTWINLGPNNSIAGVRFDYEWRE